MVNDNTPRQPQPGLVNISWHCVCGVSCEFAAEPELAERMRKTWDSIHVGDGHGPASPSEAEASRDHDLGSLEDMARSVRELRWGRPPTTRTQEV